MGHDIRDAIMDFIAHWSERTEISALQLVGWIDLSRSKFYSWRDRYGKANEHNALVPRGQQPLAPGKHTIVFDFTYDSPGVAKGGTGVLKMDGENVATLKMPHRSRSCFRLARPSMSGSIPAHR